MSDQLPPYTYVATEPVWTDCIEHLRNFDQFSIDLESNGLFAYRERICLIQISTRERDFIIDPLVGLDLTPLGELIMNPRIEKVLHASEYDLILMKREHDWDIKNLFDTMWAARVIGHEKIGLASVLGALYGMEIDKKYQRTNWCERPLSDEQLAYAQTDTHFLLQLRDDLEDDAASMGRYDELMEILEEQSHVRLPDTDFTEESFWGIQGVRDLGDRGRAILRELNILRDQIARERDRPAFKVFGNRTLIELAERKPKNMGQLNKITGLRGRTLNRYGAQLLAAIDKGRSAPKPKAKKRSERVPEIVAIRYDRLHEWRKNRARERNVASDVVMTRETMWDIAHAGPDSAETLAQIASFGEVRRAIYGEDVLSVLSKI